MTAQRPGEREEWDFKSLMENRFAPSSCQYLRPSVGRMVTGSGEKERERDEEEE